MQQYWQQLSDKFAALSSREKWLISMLGLVAVGMLTFTFLVEPAWLKYQSTSKQVTTLKLGNQRIEADILLVTAKLKRDPDRELNIELQQLMTQSQELSEQLAEVVGSLISPSQMTLLLEDVLSSSTGLHLVSLESMSAEPIVNREDQSQSSEYFLHPVRIELTGEYFAIVRYLEALETMPVKYYWRSFNYSVEEYPTARLIFEVYTLGTRQEFIGG